MQLERIEAFVYRAPCDVPVRTSFGVMTDRPALLVRAVDRDGVEGWGEVWCNFPSVGAEHRARLIRDIIAPAALEAVFAQPDTLFDILSHKFAVLAIQSGEDGPLAQAIAGLDMAVWDIAARRAGQPLHEYLGGGGASSVGAYASGLNPDEPERLAARMQADGHRAFKLKVGFGEDRDLRNIDALRNTLGSEVLLMTDANQAWDVATTIRMAHAMACSSIGWLEEPIRADAPPGDWQEIVRNSPIPLAGGENIRGNGFDDAIKAGFITVIQPDLGKWGGFSRCVGVGRRAIGEGRRFCPHWLGGGIGLLASVHLLAAVGGDGRVEVDSNPNPLRDEMLDARWALKDGRLAIPVGPGLGARPDLMALERYAVRY